MKKLVLDMKPVKGQERNSEGDFLRGKDGKIYFAFSRYSGSYADDHSRCDIAMISSSDEGETWSEPEIIAKAEQFGVKNLMSVSAVTQKDGEGAFYFLIKENDKTSTMGRVFLNSRRAERIDWHGDKAYYVVNNARIVRLKNGDLVAPAAISNYMDGNGSHTRVFVSKDDGASFKSVDGLDLSLKYRRKSSAGLQEPGFVELPDGRYYLYNRTDMGCQYECFSAGNGDFNFNQPEPSIFTAPCSPLGIFENNGVYYAIYNPIPTYNGRVQPPASWGRTPFVIRKSTDCVNFGELTVIEDDERRGYCYPSAFFTSDGSVLISYCRGGDEDGVCLQRLGIMKMSLEDIK